MKLFSYWDFFKHSALVFCIQLIANSAYAQLNSYRLGNLNPPIIIENYAASSGLPVEALTDIKFSPDGNLYLSSYDGLIRFDGTSFYSKNSSNDSVFVSDYPIALYVLKDSSIIVLDDMEEAIWIKGKKEVRINGKVGLPSSTINHIHIENGSKIWISTNYGIGMQENGPNFSIFNRYFKYNVKCAVPFDEFSVYAMTDRGLFLVTKNTIRKIYNFEDEIFADESRVRLTLTEDKQLLVAAKYGILHFNEKHELVYRQFLNTTAYQFYKDKSVNNSYLLRTMEKFFWYNVNTHKLTPYPTTKEVYGGNFVFDDSKWMGSELLVGAYTIYHKGRIIFTAPDSVNISNTAQDNLGNLWIATNGRGLFKLSYGKFYTLDLPKDPLNLNAYSMSKDQSGVLWFTTLKSGLISWDGTSIKRHRVNPTATNLEDTRVISTTSSGEVFTSIWGDGLWKKSDKSWNRILPEHQVLNRQFNVVEAFYEDDFGNYWLGSITGLIHLKKDLKSAEELRDSVGNPLAFVRTISPWYENQILLGTNKFGVWRADTKTNFIYSFLPTQAGRLIRDIYAPSKDTVWFATEDKGLVRYVTNGSGSLSIKSFNMPEIMPDWSVHKILRDRFGYWWLTNNQGLYRIKKSELDLFLDKKISDTQLLRFTESEGLPHREFNGGVMNAGIVDEKGWIWVPTQRGISFFNPADFLSDPEYEVQLKEFKTDYRTEKFTGSEITLEQNERAINLNIAIKNGHEIKQKSISYRVVPSDTMWRMSQQAGNVFISGLASGNQKIELRLNHQPSFKPVTLSIPIYVAEFWYENSYFWIFVLFLLGVLFTGSFYLIVKRAQVREDILNVKVKERTHQLEKQREETEKALEIVQQQASELQEIDKIKTEFFVRLTHELRTPLSLINGPLEHIIETIENGELADMPLRLKGIKKNAETLHSLIDQLLELYQFNVGSFKLHKQRVNLSALTKDVVENYVNHHHSDVSIIKFEKKYAEILIETDPSLWEIILTHISTISVPYINKNESLYVYFSCEKNTVSLIFENFANALDEKDFNQLYELFYNPESNEKLIGSGLGLTLAKKYVELLGGDIHIRSVEQGKNQLIIELPNLISFEKSDSSPIIFFTSEKQAAINLSNPNKLPQLLIVEDNQEFREYLNLILKDEYFLVEAANGARALEILKQYRPDLIISDVMMPTMNGFDFAKNAREMDGLKTIPLIFLTAKNTKQAIQEGLQTGAQAYLTKPVSNSILKAQIQSLIQREKSTQHLIASTKKAEKDPFRIQVDELILRHLSDPQLSIDTIAEAIHVSKSSLYRKWKEVSPSEQMNAYIIRKRLEETLRLVKDDKLTFSEASFVCGFSNPSYFSRIFKKVYHCTPSEYIEKNI
ncbi:hybrid sensor histidine kinase/response regulator [bacterium]|nr:MAG: hybrid sensor histidine kinase/response regulator [bacterium]